jgi:hypothetical protein
MLKTIHDHAGRPGGHTVASPPPQFQFGIKTGRRARAATRISSALSSVAMREGPRRHPSVPSPAARGKGLGRLVRGGNRCDGLAWRARTDYPAPPNKPKRPERDADHCKAASSNPGYSEPRNTRVR